MLMGHLSGYKSLRDITANLKTQDQRLYHLGMQPTATATQARANAGEPASLYQEIFSRLLDRLSGTCANAPVFISKQTVSA